MSGFFPLKLKELAQRAAKHTTETWHGWSCVRDVIQKFDQLHVVTETCDPTKC